MNTYIFYHSSCTDGLSAAAIFNYWIQKHDFQNKKKYHFIAGHFQMSIEDLPDLSKSIVYFLDFSFKKDLFKHVLSKASKTFLIDHHKSAYDELEEFIKQPDKYNLYTVFNLNECGTSLTWNYLFPNVTVPLVVKHIKDRDIWIWKEPYSKEYLAYLDLIELTLEEYNKHYQMVLNLSQIDFDLYYKKAIEIGSVMMIQKANMVKPIIKNTRYLSFNSFCKMFKKELKDILNCENTIGAGTDKLLLTAKEICIVNTPSLFVSDVSEALIDNGSSFLLIGYNFTQDGVRFSIRSRKDVDSISVAKLINHKAGGHQTASGGFLTYQELKEHPILKLITDDTY